MVAPFTQAVVNAMRNLYPEALADKSFDNTGLLLEAPFDPQRRQKNSVLLTIDLTKSVADEAIFRRDSIVVTYHPIIFRGLKSLTLGDTQQQSLLRLAAAGISVYSPHTAVDAAKGGLGDWLADIVTGKATAAKQISGQARLSSQSSDLHQLHHIPSYASPDTLILGAQPHTRVPIKKTKVNEHADGGGMGRIVTFDNPTSLSDVLERIRIGLGQPYGLPVAIPQGKKLEDIQIRGAAVCAGSGGHMFGEIDEDSEEGSKVDLLFTGEFSHHEALAAIEKGKCIVAPWHSNTERGYLHSVMRDLLHDGVAVEWETIRNSEHVENTDLTEALSDETVEVAISEVDRDPYGIYTHA